MADGGHEPSMEDILSSIKRIIAEDSDATLSGSRGKRSVAPARADRSVTDFGATGARDQDDVLELTEAVALDPPVQQRTPAPVAKAVDVESDEPPATKVTPKPEAPLASPTTVEASRTSLAALSALVVKPEASGSDTLEGLVRDMLRPMIAQWLDARLPEIVERQVAREVRRIVERG